MYTQVYCASVREMGQNAREHWTLPPYQRPLVWTPEQALRLVQSAFDGYPIGGLLVWQRAWGDEVLLDGQQRVAALTGVRCGTKEPAHEVGWSFRGERWALAPTDEEDDLLTLKWWQENGGVTRVERLTALRAKHGDELWEAGINAVDHILGCAAPVHALEQATAEEAVEAFRRLNYEGTPIDPEELLRLLKHAG